MYLGVDVGGTKTLVAVFDDSGNIIEQEKFPTPKEYNGFLRQLEITVNGLKNQGYKAAAVAVPARLNRNEGKLIRLANLDWENEHIASDCEKIFGCVVGIENDANLGGLYEARQWPDYEKVLYVTISTGIGTGFAYKQQLSPPLLDMEGGHILLPWQGQLTRWETFASGQAIHERFGKPASEIEPSDTAAWEYIVDNLVPGLMACIAIVEPDLMVIGGGVGAHFDRFGDALAQKLKSHEFRVTQTPKLVEATHPEEAVVYGCFEFARQLVSQE